MDKDEKDEKKEERRETGTFCIPYLLNENTLGSLRTKLIWFKIKEENDFQKCLASFKISDYYL